MLCVSAPRGGLRLRERMRQTSSAVRLAVGSRADDRRDARYQQRRPRRRADARLAFTSSRRWHCRMTWHTSVSAFREGIADADLIVSTGGLGPTPDDLTREAIAAACGLEPHVDDELLAWLREMFERRGARDARCQPKQAWLMPGASALPNAHGTAPGWWLELPDERLIIALPGPPREWQPMWRDACPPPPAGRPAGQRALDAHAAPDGHGESALVELIGEDVLRAANPRVATYARPDAVDVVVTAFAAGESSAARAGRAAAEPAARVSRDACLCRRRSGLAAGARRGARGSHAGYG